jgi:hypothetical protein
MIRVTTWTPKIDERMRELHALKLSFTEISARLNADFGLSTTRNACIGRGRRLGLPLRAHPPPRTKIPKLPKPRVRKKQQRKPPTPVLSDAPAIIPGRLDMLQLTAETCHWPTGNKAPYSFCGEPVYDDRPYCKEHCRVSYQKPEKTWQT